MNPQKIFKETIPELAIALSRVETLLVEQLSVQKQLLEEIKKR